MIHQPVPDIFGKSRLVALDLETSGLNVKYNTIIEIGMVEMVNGVVKSTPRQLFGGGHSSMYLVRRVHHIPDYERRGKRTFKDCAGKIADFLSNSIIVTHNGNSFDIPMIQRKLADAGYSIKNFKSLDTLQLVRKMRKAEEGDDADDDKKHRGRNTLENLCAEFGLVYGGDSGDSAHRGLEDAEACLDLLFFLVNSGRISVKI